MVSLRTFLRRPGRKKGDAASASRRGAAPATATSLTEAPPGSDLDGGADRTRTSATGAPRVVTYAASPGPPPGDAEVVLVDVEEEKALEAGLHEITRRTDLWFQIEVSRIERQAAEAARAWAQAALPRVDAQTEGELPVEVALQKRCAGLFQEWIEQVRKRLGDAIQATIEEVGAGLVEFRHHVAALEQALAERTALRERIGRLQAQLVGVERSFGYRSFLGTWKYLVLVGLLVVVDWVANVPVFGELLPQEAGTEQAWQDLVARSERYGVFGGPYRVLARVLFLPDVSLLALGVIIFLMFLGHVLGGSLRRLVAFRVADEPALAVGIRAQRRQAWAPLLLSAVGIGLVLAFLYQSRMQLEEVTQRRLAKAEAEVAALEVGLGRAKAAQDLQAIARIERQLPEARSVLEERRKREAYASAIAALNLPIFLLNVVLVLAAAIAAYLEGKARIVEGRLVHPAEAGLRARLEALEREWIEHWQEVRRLDARIQAGIARARYLAAARPFRGWESKARRLEGVVPLFRAENARARGVDPQNVLAFRTPPTLVLPPVDAEETVPLPAEVAGQEEELRALRQRLAGLEERAAAVPALEVAR